MDEGLPRHQIAMRRMQHSLLYLLLLAVQPCRAKVGTSPPLAGGTIAPGTSPEMVPFYAPAMEPLPGGTLSPNVPPHLVPVFAPAMAPLPGGTLSPATPPAMVPLFMPALAPNYMPPSTADTFAPNTPPAFIPIIMPAMAPPPGETLSPNTPPAMVPLFMPAMAPPPGQTFAPNTPPAMIPMLMPAMVPGPGETFAPNTMPAMIPMMLPAMIPGPGETFAPNTMPAMIPMMVPAMVPPGTTLSPATLPAMMPLLMPATLPDTCFTNNGVYASTSGTPNLIEWEYGVTVARDDITAEFFRDTILPELEIKFADALVPTLFEVEGCDVVRRRTLRSHNHRVVQQETPQLPDGVTIIGLSARPVDEIDMSIPCGAAPCFGVAGAMTVFTMSRRRHLQETETEQLVLGNIQDAIENGQFDNQGDVVGVTYVGPDLDEILDDELPDGSSSSNNKSRNIAIIGGAVGGGTALLLLAMGSFIIARNRRRDQLGNFPVMEGESNIIPDIEDNGNGNSAAAIDDNDPMIATGDDAADFNNQTADEDDANEASNAPAEGTMA